MSWDDKSRSRTMVLVLRHMSGNGCRLRRSTQHQFKLLI
jgi:hypothetical protein